MKPFRRFVVAITSAAIMLSGPGTSATLRRSASTSPSRTATCDLTKHPTKSAYLHAIQVKAAPSGSVNVRVKKGNVPVVLLLASERPVRWMVNASSGAQIQRVILVGDRSTVIGLPSARKMSRCGKSDGFIPFQVDTVDRVADALELSLANLAHYRMAASKGYEVRPRNYPEYNADNPFDRCRVDFDYGGYNITRRDVSTAHECQTLCDKYGAANSWQGRTVCVFNGATLRAYSPPKRVEGRSCRLLTPSGRNIQSYPAETENECREIICYAGAYLWERNKDRRSSQCRFRGRLIEHHGMRPLVS